MPGPLHASWSGGGELLPCGEQDAGRDGLHGLGDLVEGREGGSEPDVAVARVVAVGEGGACGREGDAGLLGELDDPRGGAVEDVEADEVAALGLGPGRHPEATQALAEDALDLGELGSDDL